jgi:nitrogen fixation-related uncharacterized protein
MSRDLQNPDPAKVNLRQNRLQTLAVIALFLVAIAGVMWFASDSAQYSDDARPDIVMKDLLSGNDDLAPASQVMVWTSRLNEVLAAVDKVGANHPGRTAELRERIAVISEFIKENEQSLPFEFDRESEVAKELTQLLWEATNLQLAGTDKSANEPSTGAVLARLDDEVLAHTQLREQHIKEQVQRATMPHVEEARREGRQLQRDTRDLEDEIAALTRSTQRIVDERERAVDRTARTQALSRDLPEIRRLLSPFISPGYTQPNKTAIDWPITTEKAPVSLSGLKRVGALQPTMKGLQHLMVCGSVKAPGPSGERPLGSFPDYDKYLTSPKNLAAVKRAQELLRTHGQTLVEERLLSP